MAENSPNGQEILGEKEKLLVTANFFFFFPQCFQKTRKNHGLFGKELKVLHFRNTYGCIYHYHKYIYLDINIRTIKTGTAKCSDNLSLNDNIEIVYSVQEFIKNSERFE